MAEPVIISGSLRNRLAISLIGGAAMLAVVLFFVVRSYAAQIAQQGQDSILEASVTSILDAVLLRDGAVEVDFPYASFSMLSTKADDRVFYAIFQDGELLSGYPDMPHGDAMPGERPTHVTANYLDVPVRAAGATRTLVGANARTQVTVVVAQTREALAVTLNGISQNVASFGAGFFVLAALLSFWATSTTIRPLRRLTLSITRRGPQDLSPVVKPVPSEMGPLVASLNQLMGRLDTSLRQSEDFIAEAAHRVRTPLATVRAYAETTLQRVEKEENRQALRSMVRAIDESSRAAGQLLDHAMITFRADHLERQTLDLVELVTELATRLTPVADMKDIHLRIVATASVITTGDPILLQNAIRNVIDNALKYAPVESEIEIEVGRLPQPHVVVRDEGQGFPLEEIETLATRFLRGNNATGTIGSGLGLTIAQDVAQAHGGSLKLSNLPKGGACVEFFV